jgi:hypothetical protein
MIVVHHPSAVGFFFREAFSESRNIRDLLASRCESLAKHFSKVKELTSLYYGKVTKNNVSMG